MNRNYVPIGICLSLLAAMCWGRSGHAAAAAQIIGPSVFVSTSPTVASSTSTVIVAAGTIHTSVEIQNNTDANIAISVSGATLTGITAGSGNPCIILVPGQEWARSGVFPSNAITCYQTSGSSTNAITVVVS